MMENNKFAGIRPRLIAVYIDFINLAVPVTLLLWYAGASLNAPILVQRLFTLFIIWILVFILNLLHVIFFTHYFGGTIGKLLVGLKVVDQNGKKLTLKRSFFRHTVGYQFSGILFGLGFISIIKDPQKQAWHDKTVGSKVIIEKNNWPLALLVLIFLIVLNLYILYSAFITAFSGPLPKEFQSLMNSLQTKQEGQKNGFDASNPAPSPSTPLGINSVEGWQTYSDKMLGFEFKYPKSLQLRLINQPIPSEIELIKATELLRIGNYIEFYSIDTMGMSFEEYINTLISKRTNLPGKQQWKYSLEGITIAGKPAWKFATNLNAGGCIEEVLFDYNKKILLLSFTMESPSCFKSFELDIFHSILSSFRFVEV